MVSTLVVPYLIVETSMQLITRHYTGDPDPMLILSPQWLAWFLAALFVWRLTTPIWRALKYPITTSIIISLTVGLFELPNVLSLPKILGFLPFWVIGLHMNRELFERLTDVRIRIASAIVLIAAFVICFQYSSSWETDWLLWKQRYDETPLSATSLEGVLQRGELLGVGLLLTFAALSLIPKRRSWTTRLGGRTIYTYLLHGYVILVLSLHYDLFNRVERFGALAVVGTIVGAVIVANLLMTAIVARLFRPFFEPKLTWLFRDIPQADDAKPTSTATT
jgi:fucose 4-O-acetylase-like acetyltransferase